MLLADGCWGAAAPFGLMNPRKGTETVELLAQGAG